MPIYEQHIQRQRGNLRVAVLVNDFADVDIDSFLLDQSQTNAALGIPTVRLASGEDRNNSLSVVHLIFIITYVGGASHVHLSLCRCIKSFCNEEMIPWPQ